MLQKSTIYFQSSKLFLVERNILIGSIIVEPEQMILFLSVFFVQNKTVNYKTF